MPAQSSTTSATSLLILLITFLCAPVASAEFSGRIASWIGSRYVVREVDLNTVSNNQLSNQHVWIDKLPPDIVANDNGCFCFEENQGFQGHDWRRG